MSLGGVLSTQDSDPAPRNRPPKNYRHPIHTFDITALDGKEKWTTYNFVVGVYYYSLTLLKRIYSVIDELPLDLNLELSQQSEPDISESSGLSQQLGNQILAEEPGGKRGQSSHVDLQPLTPHTWTRTEEPASTKKKKK